MASQDICFLWNLKVHFHVQESATCPISEPHESVAHFTTLLHFILNYLLVCNKAFSVACFLSDIPTRSLYQYFVSQMHVTCPSYLIVFDFIVFVWLSSSLDVICAVFSNLLLVYPCKVQIISPLSCLHTPLVCVSSLMWQTNFHTHKKNRQKKLKIFWQ